MLILFFVCFFSPKHAANNNVDFLTSTLLGDNYHRMDPPMEKQIAMVSWPLLPLCPIKLVWLTIVFVFVVGWLVVSCLLLFLLFLL